MGSVYKRKRHSCKLCKPHKMGWADKLKNKDRFKVKVFNQEKKEW